jgi:hypothetical protein
MPIIRSRIGILLAGSALLAAGASSLALAAPGPAAPQPVCYSTCAASARLTQAWKIVAFGGEQIQYFQVTVKPAVLGLSQTPTGTVTIESGSTTLCTIVLSRGRGSCSPSPDALPPGFHAIRGYYSGDATFAASVSNIVSLQVTRLGSGD